MRSAEAASSIGTKPKSSWRVDSVSAAVVSRAQKTPHTGNACAGTWTRYGMRRNCFVSSRYSRHASMIAGVGENLIWNSNCAWLCTGYDLPNQLSTLIAAWASADERGWQRPARTSYHSGAAASIGRGQRGRRDACTKPMLGRNCMNARSSVGTFGCTLSAVLPRLHVTRESR